MTHKDYVPRPRPALCHALQIMKSWGGGGLGMRLRVWLSFHVPLSPDNIPQEQ